MIYFMKRFVLCVTLCHFVLVFFSPFSIAITSLLDEIVFWICACLDLLVSSSSWCLERAAACDCGTPWTFLKDMSRGHVSRGHDQFKQSSTCRKN